MKIEFVTLGCKVNINETERLRIEALKEGFDVVSSNGDIVVINTCTVTHMSDKKTRKLIEKYKKRDNFIVVTGCFVDANDYVDKNVGLIVNNKEKLDIIKKLIDIFGKPDKSRKFVKGKTRAFIKIQDGCNRFCSFCIIPFARGRSYSIDRVEIIDEVNEYLSNGYKEIVLTGIHISSYGLDNGSSLIEIIKEVSSIEGVKRLRIGSLEPTIITDEFLSELSLIKSFCPHFHLSLQSGSDKVLKDMRRIYTSEDYKRRVDLIRSYFSNASITTDIIVGYPTESNDNFLETLEFVKKVKFSAIHVFPYSKREGTKAATLLDLSPITKKKRLHALKDLSDAFTKEYYKSFIGKKVEVLFEKNKGLTKHYIPVVNDKRFKRNEIVDIIVKEVDDRGIIIGED